MEKLLRILIAEDSEDDLLLLIRILKKGGYDPEYTWVQTADAMTNALREKSFDIILSDFKMPTFSGIQALTLLNETNIDIPLIIVSGAIGEETAVECMRLGARDYVMKSNLSRLLPVIGRELTEAKSRAERKRAEEALRESEEKYRLLVDNTLDIIYTLSTKGVFIFVSPAWTKLLGHPLEQVVGKPFQQFMHPDDIPVCLAFLQSLIEERQQEDSIEYRVRHSNGQWRWYSSTGILLKDKTGKIVGFHGIARDIDKRKRAEELYTNLAENSLAAVFIVQDGKFRFMNSSGTKYTGYTASEIINQNSDMFTFPGDIEMMKQKGREMVKEGGVTPYEYRILTKDSRIKWLMQIVSPINYEGKPAILGNSLDITERKRIEEDLRESQKQLQNAYQVAHIGSWRWNFIDKTIIMSEEFCRMVGLDTEERMFHEKKHPHIYTQESWDNIKIAIKNALKTGQPQAVDVEVVHSDGNNRWVTWIGNAMYDRTGKIVGLNGTAQDITEHKLAENKLKESAEEISRLYNNAPCGYHSLQSDGVIHHMNDTEIQWLGYERDEIVGKKKMWDILTPESRRKHLKTFESFKKDQRTITLEYDFIRKDGSVLQTLVHATPVYDKEGNFVESSATVIDITQIKQTQVELQAKNLELSGAYEELRKNQTVILQQEKMASLGMLSAGIAHEIKNPLAIIQQGINYQQTALQDNALMAEVIERMNIAILRADKIVKGLLSFARQDSLTLVEQEITTLLDEALMLTQHEFRAKNIELIKNYTPDLPRISVDGNQLKQVFVNLLVNGIDAMPIKGIFTISAQQINNAAGNKALKISFKDTGLGIPADKLKSIFDPFYTTKPVGNTGLGLSISKGLIDRHGGIIYAESQKEQGANIIIELPLPT